MDNLKQKRTMKKNILLLSFIMVSGFAIGQTAPIKKKNYVDEQRILNVEAATPRTGYISAPYRKTDGRWYEKDENGVESTIVGREDVYITTTVPTGNFSFKMAIDTVGIDTMYINNNSNWNRFESGGGGSSITDGNTIIGTGEIGDSLRIDTTVIATQYDISNISVGSGKFVDGTDPLDAVYTGGNVGIGTAIPAEKLEIDGNIQLQNNDYLILKSGADKFGIGATTRTDFGVVDNVSYWRYNFVNGAINNPNDIVFGHALESHYCNGVDTLTEWNFDFSTNARVNPLRFLTFAHPTSSIDEGDAVFSFQAGKLDMVNGDIASKHPSFSFLPSPQRSIHFAYEEANDATFRIGTKTGFLSAPEKIIIGNGNTFTLDEVNDRMGVNVANPSARLDILDINDTPVLSMTGWDKGGDNSITMSQFKTVLGGANRKIRFAKVDIGGQGYGGGLEFTNSAGGLRREFSIITTNSGGTEQVTKFDQNGNVGIGTTTPDRKLDIENGTLRLSDLGGGTFTGNETYLLGVESDGDVVEVDLASGMDAVVSSRSYVDNTAALVDLVSGQVYYNTTTSTFVVLP